MTSARRYIKISSSYIAGLSSQVLLFYDFYHFLKVIERALKIKKKFMRQNFILTVLLDNYAIFWLNCDKN